MITPETRQLLGPNVPIISVSISDKSGSPSVAINDEQAAYDATRHLLRLGHRHIGLLTGDPASIYVAQPRKRGYLRAMTAAGCTPVTAAGSFFYESGAAGADDLLQQEPRLTAIFAMSDEIGAAVVNELQRRGLRVPEDVSVLGPDNSSTSRHVNPPLSTMAQPLEEMGRMAVKKLLRSRDLGPKIMPHTLVERGSPHAARHPGTASWPTRFMASSVSSGLEATVSAVADLGSPPEGVIEICRRLPLAGRTRGPSRTAVWRRWPARRGRRRTATASGRPGTPRRTADGRSAGG